MATAWPHVAPRLAVTHEMIAMLRSVRKRVDDWLCAQDGRSFCASFNRVNRFHWKYPIALAWSEQHGKIVVDDGARRIYIARPRRARRYQRGVTAKLEALADESRLRRIDFRPGDWIVDCGANVGEVEMWLKSRGVPLNFVCVEPEEREAECCDLNVFDGERRGERHLERIEYIAADVGPERGVDQEPTAAQVVNHLLERGFRMVDFHADRVVCLFRNTRFDRRRVKDAADPIALTRAGH